MREKADKMAMTSRKLQLGISEEVSHATFAVKPVPIVVSLSGVVQLVAFFVQLGLQSRNAFSH
jgi:hypothetical protein